MNYTNYQPIPWRHYCFYSTRSLGFEIEKFGRNRGKNLTFLTHSLTPLSYPDYPSCPNIRERVYWLLAAPTKKICSQLQLQLILPTVCIYCVNVRDLVSSCPSLCVYCVPLGPPLMFFVRRYEQFFHLLVFTSDEKTNAETNKSFRVLLYRAMKQVQKLQVAKPYL